VVLEKDAPGGQAGSSSKIENYLGFPTGISGQELSDRAFVQAEKFGAHIAIARSADRLLNSRSPYAIALDNGESAGGELSSSLPVADIAGSICRTGSCAGPELFRRLLPDRRMRFIVKMDGL
jgi:hypothetical protein